MPTGPSLRRFSKTKAPGEPSLHFPLNKSKWSAIEVALVTTESTENPKLLRKDHNEYLKWPFAPAMEMSSNFPTTPGRGRSRFSKMLPQPPEEKSLSTEKKMIAPSLLQSALPPLPEASKVVAIPRRPVGAQTKHSKTPSIASVSSVYSDGPGLSRSLSNGSSYNTRDSLSGVDSTPPLPPKDHQKTQVMSPSPTILASPLSSLHSSPSRPEIWRRRSVRSEKGINFPELKLDKSNGSTASPPGRQEQPARAQIPRSLAGRRPIPARPAPPQPDLMGNKLAKLKNKSLEESTETGNDEAPNPFTSPKRLPTPEYLRTDEAQPLTPQVMSPLSPATPPEEQAPEVPSKSEARLNVAYVLLNATNRQNLLSTHSRETSETLTITSEPPVMKSPQPKKAFAAMIPTLQLSPSKASPLPLPCPISPPAGLGINLLTFPPYTEGAVLPGLPLSNIHLDCYQAHKFMRSSRNTLCPIACMVCEKKDAEMRWKCTWCCLSACGSCMQVLSSIPGKDLRNCLERIGKLEKELGPGQ